MPLPAAARSSPVLPAASKAWGASLLRWQKRYFGWSLGSSSKPILTDSCGERIDGVFYLNSTPTTGLPKRVVCRFRRGTRLLGLVAAAVALPRPGESDAELLARFRSRSDPSDDHPKAVLDGRPLAPAVARSFRRSGVYRIPLQPGKISFQITVRHRRHLG